MAQRNPGGGKDQYSSVLRELRNPRLAVEDVVGILRRRNLPAEAFTLVTENGLWIREYQVQLTLVRNPRTPLSLSLRYLRHLYLHDLGLLLRDVNLPVTLRNNALELIKTRLRNLALGDKIALAKSASSGFCPLLLEEKDPQVVDAVLLNSRLREGDLFRWIHQKRTTAEQLQRVFACDRWIRRYQVRLSLIQNPLLPPTRAYEILDSLMYQHLVEVTRNDRIPPLIRNRARKVLERKLLDLPQEELVALAEFGGEETLDLLVQSEDPKVLRAAGKNAHLLPRHAKVLEGKAIANGQQASNDDPEPES